MKALNYSEIRNFIEDFFKKDKDDFKGLNKYYNEANSFPLNDITLSKRL